jgi:ribose transport system ATP-binding protein
MKILSGAHPPDAGEILLDGQPFAPANPFEARRRGIAMIYQELTLAPHLSVEENICLGEEPGRFGWLSRSRRRDLARRALSVLHYPDLPLEAPVSACGPGERQIVEIARALISEPRVLIMDEPTSSLTQADAENLFGVIKELRSRGVSVIYISHFLEECQRIGDTFTVLRDGESIASGEMASADLRQIIRWMVGREISEIYPRPTHAPGEPVLELRRVAGKVKPRNASLVLRAGEIFGVAGLVGAGRTETLRACFGLDPIVGGEIFVKSSEATRRSPAQRLASGIGLLSEDRKTEGLMLNQSLADNLTLTRYGAVSRFGLIADERQRATARHWISQLEIRARDVSQPVSQLSGGNQQKVALGRLLHHEAEILLLDEPTRGIDVGSKAQIYKLIVQLAAEGKAILVVSSYLPELLGICHTIGVMCRGALTDVRPAAQWTEHEIMAAAIGQT